MNVVARHMLSDKPFSDFSAIMPELQAFDLLWVDVRSPSSRI
ncbi:MAG: hypothetical protein AB7G62_16545 [Magnetospirillum sp.]